MQIEIVMPKMGESLTEGTILKWLKKPGDKVERDEMILEISTDKVDTEIPSPAEGILVQILALENETIEVGKAIAIIETETSSAKVVAEKVQTQTPKKEEKKVPEQKAAEQKPVVKTTPAPKIQAENLVDIIMPKMGESLTEGTVIKWLKKVGDKVERDEMILEISTDKVDTEVPSPIAGTLAEILAAENETVEVGKTIARIATGDVKIEQTQQAVPAKVAETKSEARPEIKQVKAEVKISDQGSKDIPRISGKRFYSPLVRSIAEAEKLNLAELDSINGTGMEGRVTKQDVMNYLSDKKSGKVTQKETAIEPTHTPKMTIPVTISHTDEVIPMDRIRQIISDHMVYSKHTSAHVTSVGEADVTEIFRFRNKIQSEFTKNEGFKLTYTPFFVRAVVDGVKAFPRVNVSVDGKNIILHKNINIGVATALDNGNLIVPVVKNADALSISGLARSIYDLSTRARNKKLNPDDIQEGTISLTNVGTFGTLFGTPIINQPQTAIIGVGAIKKRPVVKEVNGENLIAIRDMMYVSITYDHRVIDGMLAGQCLAAIIKSLESMDESTIAM